MWRVKEDHGSVKVLQKVKDDIIYRRYNVSAFERYHILSGDVIVNLHAARDGNPLKQGWQCWNPCGPRPNTDLMEKLKKAFETAVPNALKSDNSSRNHVSLINDWYFMSGGLWKKETNLLYSSRDATGTLRRTTYEFGFASKGTLDGVVVILGEGQTVKESQQRAVEALFKLFRMKVPQMEQSTPAGNPVLTSDVRGGTILTGCGAPTRVPQKTIAPVMKKEITLQKFSSVVKPVEVPEITDKWIPLEPVRISATSSNFLAENLHSWDLPRDLYKQHFKGEGLRRVPPNLTPIAMYVYGRYEIEMKFLLTASKLMTGKLIVAVDHSGARHKLRLQELLNRRHIILDVSAESEGVLDVPFIFPRSFIHNFFETNTGGIRQEPGRYASVYVAIRNVLRLPSDSQSQVAYLRPYYRFKSLDLAGPSYALGLKVDPETNTAMKEAQMMGALAGVAASVAGSAIGALGKILEGKLKRVGRVRNQDKPLDNERLVMSTPRAVSNFCHGVGPTQVVPLRLDPMSTVPILDDHLYGDPTTIQELTSIWGHRDSFAWKMEHQPGTVLYTIDIEPAHLDPKDPAQTYMSTLTYLSLCHQYWSGSIELRFDFVSNMYHSGILQATVCISRQTENLEDESAMLTKTFDLCEQKSFNLVVPHLADVPIKRTAAFPFQREATNKFSSTFYRSLNPVRVKLRVVNPLVATATAPNTLEVNVMWRGGSDFELSSPVSPPFAPIFPMSNFPPETGTEWEFLSHYKSNTEGKPLEMPKDFQVRKTAQADGKPETNAPAAAEPPAVAEIPPISAETGIEQTIDTTATLPQPTRFNPQTTDSTNRIKDVLRRPILIAKPVLKSPYTTKTLKGDDVLDVTQTSEFWIPVAPPSPFHGHRAAKKIFPFIPDNAGQNLSVALLGMYGGWRGSNRYHIVVEPLFGEAIVYVTYIPQCGTRYFGYKHTTLDEKMTSWNMGCTGLATEMIATRVNPIGYVETPFDVEVGWCRTWTEDVSKIGPYRDQDVFSAGHLIITCDIDVRLSIYWSAGDDFELINYQGAPFTEIRSNYFYNDDFFKYTLPSGTATTMSKKALDTRIYEAENRVSEVKKQHTAFETTRTAAIAKAEREGAPVTKEVVKKIVDASTVHVTRPQRQAQSMKPVPAEPPPDLSFTLEDTFFGPESDFLPKFKAQAPGNEGAAREQPAEIKSIIANASRVVFGTVAAIACAASPAVAAPIIIGGTIASACYTGASHVKETKENVKEATEKLTATAEEIKIMANHVLSSVEISLNTIFDVTSEIKSAVFNFVLDLFLAIKQPYTVLPVSIIRLFGNLFGAKIEKLMGFSTELTTWFNHFFHPETPEQTIGSGLRNAQGPTSLRSLIQEDPTKKLVGLLVGMIGVSTGVILDKKTTGSILTKTLTAFTTTQGISYINQVIRFMTEMFDIIRDVVLSVCGYEDAKLVILKNFKDRPNYVVSFIKDAELVLNPWNTNQMLSPEYRTKLWITVIQANAIRRMLLLTDSKLNPALLGLCQKILTFATENAAIATASPVRYEPYALTIVGEPGIGKSFLTTDLVSELLEKSDIINQGFCNELIYYRSAGLKFWDGFSNQLVIVYDDFMNMISQDELNVVISELYQIVTPAILQPPMASLQSKGIRGNPKLLVMMTNDAFPTGLLEHTCSKPKAVLRRRAKVIRAVIKPQFEEMALNGELANSKENPGDTLDFKIHKSTSDEKQGFIRDPDNPTEDRIYTYADIKGILLEDFKRHNDNQLIQIRTKLNQVMKTMGKGSATELKLLDPFCVFYNPPPELEQSTSESMLPSEVVAEMHDLLLQMEDVPDELNALREITPEKDRTVPLPTFQRAGGDRPTSSCWTGDEEPGCRRKKPEPKEEQGPGNGKNKKKKESFEQSLKKPLAEVPLCPNGAGKVRQDIDYARRAAKPKEEISMIDHSIKVPCTICREDREAYFSCSQTPGEEHPVCFGCQNTRAMGRLDTCHICDKPVVAGDLIVTPKELAIIKHPQGRGFWLDLIDRARGCDYGVFETVQAYRIALWKYVNIRENIVKMNAYPRIICTEVMKRIQANLPEALQPQEFTARRTGFSKVAFEDLWLTPEDNDECPHKDLIKNLPLATYDKGVMEVFSEKDLSFRAASINPCKNNCLLDKDEYKAACIEWCEEHSTIVDPAHVSEEDRIPPFCFIPSKSQRPYKAVDFMAIFWSKVYSHATLGNLLKGITALSSAFATIFALKSAFNWMMRAPVKSITLPPIHEQQVMSSGSELTSRLHKKPARQKQKITLKRSQAGNTAVPEGMGRIMGNYITIKLRGETESDLIAVGLFGRSVMVPKHYISYLEDKRPMFIEYAETSLGELPFSFDKQFNGWTEAEEADLAFFQLPNSFPQFKDIRNLLMTDDDWAKPHSNRIIFLHGKNRTMPTMAIIPIEFLRISNVEYVRGPEDNDYMSTISMVYNFSSQGACGSLLLKESGQRPIMGFHYSGSGIGLAGEGSGIRISREIVDEYADGIVCTIKSAQAMAYGEPDETKTYFPPGIQVNLLGKSEVRSHQTSKTQIIESQISQLIKEPPETQPAIMSSNDPRYKELLDEYGVSPLVAGCAKHGILTTNFEPETLNFLTEVGPLLTIPKLKPQIVDPRPLTVKEAAMGFPNIPGYEAIKFDTSAGYPYNTGTRKTKAEWTTITRREDGSVEDVEIDPFVLETIETKENLRKDGIVPHTIFIDTLKDERKKLAKLKKVGGTRVFCMSPYDYTLAMRQSYLHFLAAYKIGRFQQMSAVGINVDGPQWSSLVNHLFQVGRKVVALDYSNFGPGFNACVAKIATQGINSWVKDNVPGSDNSVLECLSEECINSIHIMGDLVYQQVSGSPSGAPWTVVINSEVNKLYVLAAWYNLMKDYCRDNRVEIVDAFRQNVRLVVYGDDLIMTVSDDICELFNGSTITEFFAQYGITATDAAKTGSIPKWSEIEQVTFLKRGFKQHPVRQGQWLAPIELTSQTECARWIRRTPDRKAATEANANQSLRLAYGHGPKYFAEERKRLNDLLAQIACPAICLTWNELDEIVWNSPDGGPFPLFQGVASPSQIA